MTRPREALSPPLLGDYQAPVVIVNFFFSPQSPEVMDIGNSSFFPEFGYAVILLPS